MQQALYPPAATRADAEMFQTGSLASELAICDREQQSIQDRPDVQAGMCPAWLVTLGMEDWEAEKRLIRQGVPRPQAGAPCR